MTVKEKITQLNRDFQKSYYDNDLGYFQYSAPEKIDEIISFIITTAEKEGVGLGMDSDIELLQKHKEELKNVSDTEKDNVKDNWLLPVKINVSQILWRFHYKLWNFKESILNKEV